MMSAQRSLLFGVGLFGCTACGSDAGAARPNDASVFEDAGLDQVDGGSDLTDPRDGGGEEAGGDADAQAAADATSDAELGPCSTPLPTTVQAEAGQLNGVDVKTETSGFSGDGYVAGFEEVDDAVTFTLCVPNSGYYTLLFRYANATNATATRSLVIDQRAFPAPSEFPSTFRRAEWRDGGRRAVYLERGKHDIALRYTSSDAGTILLDSVTLRAGPSPSEASVRSLLMNDGSDLVVGFHAAQLYPADDRGFGPRMTTLHTSDDWPTNQLDEAQLFIRDATSRTAYDEPNKLETHLAFVNTDGQVGELQVEYGPYADEALPVAIRRRQIVPPSQKVVLVIYEVRNFSGEARDIDLLEWADLHNNTGGPSEDHGDTGERGSPSKSMSAAWNADAGAWQVDLTDANGTAIAIGALTEVDQHVAGAPKSGGPDAQADLVQSFFGDPSKLQSSASYKGKDVGVGFLRRLHLAADEMAEVAFFYTVASDIETVRDQAQKVRKTERSSLVDAASQRWHSWLSSGTIGSLSSPVDTWREALEIALLTIAQAQQPEFGSFVASTNPAYYYSIWPRDASVTAMALDAAGYLDAGERYWKWMANAQANGDNPDYPKGTWWTNYGYWSKSRGISFVHPEWDSLGLFLVGVYRHHLALKKQSEDRAGRFLDALWPAVRNAASFISDGARNPNNHGFGPEDYSIWEEDLAFQTFTQTTYVAGLRAAELLAQAHGEDGKAWGDSADTVRAAIMRPVSADDCPGLWNDDKVYFIRSVSSDCKPDKRVDSATELLWVLGVLGAQDSRAAQHRDAVLKNLTPSDWGYGISRYEGDTFYYSAAFSPGGKYEATAPTPTWPQTTMYMSMLEHWRGLDARAKQRLSWYVATTPHGYVPHGEAVDWNLQRPLISTASEPVTGAWFILGLLNFLDAFDPRVPPHDGWDVSKSSGP